MLRKANLLLLRVACLLLLTSTAVAQRVLVVRPPPEDLLLTEAFGRLRAELELQRFEVIVLDKRSFLDPDVLEREAQERGAFAAIALQREASGTAAAVWIVDRLTGKTTQRKLAIESTGDGPTLLAIRAVDLLRASLLELAAGDRPPADVLGVERAPPPPEVLRFAHYDPRFQLGVGALILASPALGAALGVSLSARYRALPRLSLGVQLGGPALGGEFRPRIGAASVRQEFALAYASWNLASGERWEWGPRWGVGVSHLLATGSVEPPLVARADDVWSLAASAGLGVTFHFGDSLSLAAAAACFALVPQPVVAVADQESSPLATQALVSAELGVSF